MCQWAGWWVWPMGAAAAPAVCILHISDSKRSAYWHTHRPMRTWNSVGSAHFQIHKSMSHCSQTVIMKCWLKASSHWVCMFNGLRADALTQAPLQWVISCWSEGRQTSWALTQPIIAKPAWSPWQPLSPHSLSGVSSNQRAAQPFDAHGIGGGGASRWCRTCCMSDCSNLDPVKRGSLIPDYSSMGLRHADAQVCTHLQSPYAQSVSALNLKPHQVFFFFFF